MLFSRPKLIFGAFGAAGLGLIIFLSYRHYVGLIDEVGTLRATNAQLEVEIDVQRNTISQQEEALQAWRNEAQAQTERLEAQRSVAEAATRELRRLNGIFAEHDLTRLTLARPGLIENRINGGTRILGRVLQCASTPGCELDE